MGETQAQQAQEVYGEAAPPERIYTVAGGDWDPIPDDADSRREAESLTALNRLVAAPPPTCRQFIAVSSTLVAVALMSLLTQPWDLSDWDRWIYLSGMVLFTACVLSLLFFARRSLIYRKELTVAAFTAMDAARKSSSLILWEMLEDAASVMSSHGLVDEALALRYRAYAAKLSVVTEPPTSIRVPAPRTAEPSTTTELTST